MDLYADLPLAKGAAKNADGDEAPAVWAKGVPAFVPSQATGAASKVSMLPASLAGSRAKSPAGRSRGAGFMPVKSAGRGVSLAFRPASVGRKPAVSSTQARANVFGETATAAPAPASAPAPAAVAASAVEGDASRGGLGFVAATTWTQVTVQKDTPDATEEATVSVDAGGNSHFFQASYRDEYHPSRPNNYEGFCEERAAKKKMATVKRELEHRQREQERESKREREQFAKDVSEGKAPSIAMPSSAGRGRGMTVPAWMKKKIEESACKPKPGTESINVNANSDQFDDAASPVGLDFNRPKAQPTLESDRGSSKRTPVLKDEFGRDIAVLSHASRRPDGAVRHSREDFTRKRSRSRSRDRSHRSSRSDDRQEEKSTSSSHSRRRTSRFDRLDTVQPQVSRPGRVVLLQNMVGPGEVDDELEGEVKEECATKYGPVVKCVVFESKQHVRAEEAVRIFVEFQHQIHADQALNGLNERFFGGRRVKATYYDEETFTRLDLSG